MGLQTRLLLDGRTVHLHGIAVIHVDDLVKRNWCMFSKTATWAFLSLTALASPVLAQAQTTSSKPAAIAAQTKSQTYVLSGFNLVPIQESMLSAMKPGAIIALPVVDGASVQEGDVLGQLDDRESQANIKAAEAELNVAKKQGSSEAPVQAAVATQAVAKAEWEKAVAVNETRANAVNAIEVERLKLTWEKAGFQIEVAQQELDVALLNIGVKAAQLEVAQLDAELRKIRAPYAGEIVKVNRHVGEWLQAGDPVLHMVQMDRLRVSGYLYVYGSDATETEPAQPAIDPSLVLGRECEVLVESPKGSPERFKSKIGFVSPVQDVGGKVRVWVEIENRKVNGRWVAQPGQLASVVVQLDPPAKPKANAKAPAGKPEQEPANQPASGTSSRGA
jgi:multidrug efflux pump subunit AcrA (membrane-fusion protein)